MKIKVGVFFGGKSVEHEVSVITALQAIENMDKEKYDIIPIYITKDNKMYTSQFIGDITEYRNIKNLLHVSTEVILAQKDGKTVLLRNNKKIYESLVYDYIDIAFPIVHGTNVEDGTIQGYLKMFNVPYVGCDILSSSVGMDKYVCKCLLKQNDIPVLDGMCFNSKEYYEEKDKIVKDAEARFNYPIIVKPVNLGSSVGIKIAKSENELKEAIEDALKYSRRVLLERAIQNIKEVNCSVVGDYENAKASECEEPVKTEEILSYSDKYMHGGKKTGGIKTEGSKTSMNAGVLKLPAEISEETKNKIQNLALKTFKVLGCSGVIRIDFIIDKDTNEIYVNEVNTIPGSLSFHLWRATGLNYTELLDELIDLSLKKKREEQNMTFSFDTNLLAGYSVRGIKGIKGVKGK